MKRFFMMVIILMVGLAAYYFIFIKRGKDKENSFEYRKVKVEKRLVKDFIDVTGQIEPLNRVEILPPTGGRIEKIFVEEGTEVKSGDVLCLMSSSDRVAILDAARSISEEEYKKWQDSYKPIKVLAPISGRIILRNIVEGQTVSGGTVLFAMSDRLIAVASVDESEIGKVKVGQMAIITLDAYPEVKINGRVFQILDEGRNISNVIIYKVKINLEKIPNFLKSQMTANIKILIASKKVLVIPQRAVEYSRDGKTYVITGFDEKKNPVKKEIKIGKDYEDVLEVKGGLSEGDDIIMKITKYSKQQVNTGTNPFIPQRRPSQRNIMRRI